MCDACFKPGFTWQNDPPSRWKCLKILLMWNSSSGMVRVQEMPRMSHVGCTKQTNYAHLCGVPIEPTIIRRLRGHVWTHGLAPLLFSRPLLFEEDYSPGTSVGVDPGPWHTRQAVGWQMPLTCMSCGAVTLSYSFTCETHIYTLTPPLFNGGE